MCVSGAGRATRWEVGEGVTFSLAEAGFVRVPPWLLAVKLQCCRAAVYSARLTASFFETAVADSMVSAVAAAAADPATSTTLAAVVTALSPSGTVARAAATLDGIGTAFAKSAMTTAAASVTAALTAALASASGLLTWGG